MLNALGLPGPMAVVDGSGKIQQRLVSQSYRNPLTCAICNSHQKRDKAFNGRTMRNTGEWTKPLPGLGRHTHTHTHKKGHDGVLRSFKRDTRRKNYWAKSSNGRLFVPFFSSSSSSKVRVLMQFLPRTGVRR